MWAGIPSLSMLFRQYNTKNSNPFNRTTQARMANGSKSFFKRSGKQSCSAVSKACSYSQTCGTGRMDGSCVVVDDTGFLLGLTTLLDQVLRKCVKVAQAFFGLATDLNVTGTVTLTPKTYIRLVYIKRYTRPADGVYDIGILFELYVEMFGPDNGPMLFQYELTA